MEISEKALDVINDLIEINNDRVAGFEKAGKDLGENGAALSVVFNKLAGESSSYAAELYAIALQYGGEPTDGTSASGALHRTWLDIKAAFTGSDPEAILNECERGEDAIKAAYNTALEPDNELSPDLAQILQAQFIGISEGHDLIKSLRNKAAQNDDNAVNAGNTDDYSGSVNTEQPYSETTTAFETESAYSPEYEATESEGLYDDETDDASGDSKLMEFFVNELKDLLWAERELVDTLPDMADAATSIELKTAFENHLVETETHVARLEQVFAVLGLEPEARKCQAMAGIVEEGEEIISATEDGTAQRDVGLIFAGQKAEHYEIASYGGMISLAKTLGYYEIAEVLVLTLEEEKIADGLLTEIAESQANYDAANEPAED
ncbi:hypothetical protein GCM10023149_21270 [Mucilaginibacter gynuensis]|uniref:DUF2383 domain-containing protein n=1 Tax=Mucilaginibacter gynuensis TaxID=1302236 RepID=A0ABP8GBW2_9SPHI